MLESYPKLSIIPILCALVLAIKFRQAYLALFLGLLSGTTILARGNILKGIIGAVDRNYLGPGIEIQHISFVIFYL
ncbi:MAG: hypothetical protein JSV96_18185 [Candidatus Aminicenantes bacterium]|nr:MAG: hypothetical protein JSV96_18185 [Candidatus Aminicenantes bacterium]